MGMDIATEMCTGYDILGSGTRTVRVQLAGNSIPTYCSAGQLCLMQCSTAHWLCQRVTVHLETKPRHCV